ncbi:NYN domain-containing protein [Nostoc sp. FACHB-973]|uniref:NYN domain-containing protein n=1 Tax=Desmonostoc muscorum LEGE 12446 TaxID=1828758 RepID=A0A8J6ZIB9_DESMC|nr:NYN domain-containing protein [Desmonostoc muscorum]MBD2517687.1 NYN domain-containing protein [Nostoc sp. FACHB-973]MCF2150992.1 NYN domain-containing protein [Desmonostoc muscorum LEGE 12446]
MIHANKSSDRQTSQQKNSIAIFWDLQNVYSIQKTATFLLDFAQFEGRIKCKKLYYNSHHQNQVFAKNNLEVLDITCVDVRDTSENSADYRLMADCVKAVGLNPSLRTIILVLGDWDYAGLISVLQSLGKKVIIFAQRGSASLKLIKLVGNDNFHFIDELPQLVEEKNQASTTSIKSHINYNEAIEYLIEAINTILSQGKPTLFGRIDKFMRQNCANYQGFSSIHTPDGKKFKSFSQFVDAAVKDGKVQKQGQELFLIELNKLAA